MCIHIRYNLVNLNREEVKNMKYVAIATATERQAKYGYWSPAATQLVSGKQLSREANKVMSYQESPSGEFDSIDEVKAAWEAMDIDTSYFRVI